jgi:phosphatidylinositol alpha-1,6-mannosyltransferase
MKVCIATWQLAPDSGWGRYSLGLVRGLREQGVETRVLTEQASPRPDRADLGPVVPCLSGAMGALDHPRSIIWNTLQIWRNARGCDLVHFFVEPYVMVTSLTFPWPYVVTVHGTYGVIPLKQNLATRTLFRRAMGGAASIVCVSRFTKKRVAQAMPLQNLEVIANGLEVLRPTGGDDGGEIAGSPVILGVGALKPRKGYHVTIEAVARLRNRFPNIHYYLVGDDQDRRYIDRLRDLVRHHDLEDHVTITGRVSDARLDALYRRADVFVLTPVNSGVAFEGFGLTYLEANAYGKPVVGSLDCGAEDAIIQGENGLLVAQDDVDGVARAVASLLDDRKLATEMGERGRQRALGMDWSNVARDYRAVYERILGR